jgi:hypothetical protein
MRISKRQLKRIIREEKARARRLYEDSIDSELDNLKKNIGDDIEHIRDLKDDVKDDHEEELHAEEEKERKDESFRGRHLRHKLRRIIREESPDQDWGMGSHEDSRTRPGEEDYTGHAGDESKTHPGEDFEGGGDVEHKAMTAMAAIHDLASAAGVELQTDVSGPSDVAVEDVPAELAMENRRRLKNKLKRIVREQSRRSRRHLREDSVDTELDNLKKNVEDDIEHIRDLHKDIKDDHEEEVRAEKEEDRKDESRKRRLRRIVRENTRTPRRVRRTRR